MTSTNIDLSTCAHSQSIDCDVCIVGAGAAGSYLAFKLAQAGKKVAVLEAGDAKGVDAHSVGFVPEFLTNYYPGAIEGRSFGLGGSTSRWGGLLVPHTENDSDHDDADDSRAASWRDIVGVVTENKNSVLSDLGYAREPDFAGYANTQLSKSTLDGCKQAGLVVVSSLFLPFRHKNLSFFLTRRRLESVHVYRNAVVSSWETSKTHRVAEIRSLKACSRTGHTLNVQAKSFVISAGTIETTRILLELDDSSADLTLSPDLGKYLGDHLSIPIADVANRDLKRTTADFAPRFAGPWMRSLRFISTGRERKQPRSFSHFVFENENPGFKLAKNVLSSVQAKRWPNISMNEIAAGLGGAFRLGAYRYLRSKLFIPRDTQTRLQLDIEQQPSARNSITLGVTRDAYNRKVAQIDWRISDRDMDLAQSTADLLLQQWMLSDLPSLVRRDLRDNSEKPHDAYHPVGTCRLGIDDRAVVDLGLKVCGTSNLFAVTTGVLPTAGTANPTFTMLCLVLELSRRILQQL